VVGAGLVSALLVDHCQHLSDGLSHDLYATIIKQTIGDVL
jgi:hypothetical protein